MSQASPILPIHVNSKRCFTQQETSFEILLSYLNHMSTIELSALGMVILIYYVITQKKRIVNVDEHFLMAFVENIITTEFSRRVKQSVPRCLVTGTSTVGLRSPYLCLTASSSTLPAAKPHCKYCYSISTIYLYAQAYPKWHFIFFFSMRMCTILV